MKPMRVLIVDDEPLALRRLEIILGRRGDIEIVGACRDGEQALEAICAQKPDAVFLDVRMPLVDGFGVTEAFENAQGPAVVFVTAFDEYALRAFESRAVDYLLKPVAEERLDEAIDRLRERLAERSAGERVAELQDALDGLRAERRAAQDQTHHDFWVKDRQRVVRVAHDEIEWVEAERDYVRLHVEGRSWLLRETMAHMESRLDPARFVRVHRSAIVNAARIRAARATPSGARFLKLQSGAEVRVGRSYETVVARLFSNR